MTGSSSSGGAGQISKGPQVFINFRGVELRKNFVDSLVIAFEAARINFFIDSNEQVGRTLQHLLVRIEQSRVALAIFSKEYTTSAWCLDELVRIKERMDDGKLIGIPIFYKVDPSVVSNLEGDFGDKFRRLKRENRHELVKTHKWKEALTYMTTVVGLHLREESGQTDNSFIESIVRKVQEVLADIPMEINAEDSFMIYAKRIKIAHSEKPENWTWSSIHEAPNGKAIDIATLKVVYWMNIEGNSFTSQLTPETKYEVVFVVKLEEDAIGWHEPVNLLLIVTMRDKTVIQQEQTRFLDPYIGDKEWVDIKAGDFVAPPKESPARISFTMCQHDATVRKTGLVVKGVAFRPLD
ncbi:protein PHLOEM PROTEIN 2-LIKE A6-like [Raphanus sativus]|uniref:Protein PHLOEM PROTEIN 2-LIKE A6-like n=1 Tax=Raphanus sativus TaxID=3726 RepID=A0A6J0P1B8_RAPSA|nr:protein PHLOEM PROTEIN 2-LIKE A6-like [Raphanus sativus]